MNIYKLILSVVLTCSFALHSFAQRGPTSFMQITYVSEKGTERSFKLLDKIKIKTASGNTYKGQIKHIGKKGISIDNKMVTDKVIGVKYISLFKCFSKIKVVRFELREPTYE